MFTLGFEKTAGISDFLFGKKSSEGKETAEHAHAALMRHLVIRQHLEKSNDALMKQIKDTRPPMTNSSRSGSGGPPPPGGASPVAQHSGSTPSASRVRVKDYPHIGPGGVQMLRTGVKA